MLSCPLPSQCEEDGEKEDGKKEETFAPAAALAGSYQQILARREVSFDPFKVGEDKDTLKCHLES